MRSDSAMEPKMRPDSGMDPIRRWAEPVDKPPLALAGTLTFTLVVLIVILRLRVYPGQVVPFGYGLPLMIALWHRDWRLHLGTTATFCGLLLLKSVQIHQGWPHSEPDLWTFTGMHLLNILGAGIAIQIANSYRDRIELRRKELERVNAELETANEELVARDEEITGQNEELQAQTEELESQAEELRFQQEELARSNSRLLERGELLEVLLRYGRDLAGVDEVLTEVCRVAARILGGPQGAAAVTERRGDSVQFVCWAGFEKPLRESWSYENSFTEITIERGGTAALHDLALRPDLAVAAPASYRSILATPLRLHGASFPVLEVYRREPYEYTEDDFQLIEWIGAQCSLILGMLSLNREIVERRRAAEQASARKTQFLAAVSHDIRTPANAITLLAELIRRYAEVPEKSKEILKLAADLQNASRSLVELVTDVLDLTRYDSGDQAIQESDFGLRPVLDTEFRKFAGAAEAAGLRLVLDFEAPDVPLRTDRLKLARILDNLIGNAIKFTEAGEVRVRVLSEAGGGVRCEVIDTGIGIGPDHLASIFDEFLQLRNPERDRSKGTGLGLAICRRLAGAIGCLLSVESQAGRGSIFRLRIPPQLVRPRDAEVPGAPEVERAEVSGREPDRQQDGRLLAGLRVLLVEDHETMRRSAAKLLAEYGAEVIEAAGGQKAIQALYHEDPDILLLDLMLPDMDGREVLKALPSVGSSRLRCVLVVTGDVSAARIEEAARLGADDLIRKPIEARMLVDAIARHLEKNDRTARPGGLRDPQALGS